MLISSIQPYIVIDNNVRRSHWQCAASFVPINAATHHCAGTAHTKCASLEFDGRNAYIINGPQMSTLGAHGRIAAWKIPFGWMIKIDLNSHQIYRRYQRLRKVVLDPDNGKPDWYWWKLFVLHTACLACWAQPRPDNTNKLIRFSILRIYTSNDVYE